MKNEGQFHITQTKVFSSFSTIMLSTLSRCPVFPRLEMGLTRLTDFTWLLALLLPQLSIPFASSRLPRLGLSAKLAFPARFKNLRLRWPSRWLSSVFWKKTLIDRIFFEWGCDVRVRLMYHSKILPKKPSSEISPAVWFFAVITLNRRQQVAFSLLTKPPRHVFPLLR